MPSGIGKPLTVGMTISSQQRRVRGLLGALAIDPLGDVYGLTARSVLFHGASSVVLDEDKRILGHRTGSALAPSQPQPITRAGGAFRINSGLTVDAAVPDLTGLRPPAIVDDLIGARVRKLDRRGWQVAVISRLFGTIRVNDPAGGQAPRYYDVVELEPNHPRTFGIAGDGGALVVTESDEPLGLLIGGWGRRYFIAPLAPVLADRGLRLLSAADAAIHNDDARARPAPAPISSDLLMDRYIAEVEHLPNKSHGLTLLDRTASSLPLPEIEKSPLAKALEVA
jgi:hypothetical protein